MGRRRGCHLPTLLGLPLLILALKEDRIVIVSDVIYPIKTLEWSVYTGKTIRSEEEECLL
jgi:hypothetical protein